MAKLTLNDEKNLVADWKTGAYSQRDLASKYNCSKGKVSQLTEGIEKAKNGHLVAAKVSLLSARAHLTDEEMTAIMTAAQNEVFNSGIVTNVQQLALIRNNQLLSKNKKTVMLKVAQYNADGQRSGEDYEPYEVELSPTDIKEIIEGTDKASITLGVSQRHAPRTEINNNNAQQNIITVEIE